MQKIVLYTQRVEIIESYNERRDCVDQNIPLFLEECGYTPLAVANVVRDLDKLVAAVNPVGIVLTGGNSLVCYGGNAPERDDTDRRLIEIAIKNNIPIYGFCRGMQSILHYFGCTLENVENHVAIRHVVQGDWGIREVNSYHNQACKQIKEPLRIMAMTQDGVIETVECRQHRMLATMWHPEREKPFAEEDRKRLKELFG